MMCKVLISAFILCTFSSQNVLGQIGMGPLNIKLVKATQCPSEDNVLKLAVVDIDGKQGFDFHADLPYPLDSSISYSIIVDKVQNGQIQKGVFKHGGNHACADMKKFLGNFWTKLASGGGIPDTCPIPAGNYAVENLVFEEKDFSVRTFLYGRFLMNLEIKKGKKAVGCMNIEFTNSRPGESV